MKGKNNGRDEILKENLIRQKRHQSVSYWYMKGKNNGRDEILKENLIRQKRHQSVSYKNLLIKDDTGLLI